MTHCLLFEDKPTLVREIHNQPDHKVMEFHPWNYQRPSIKLQLLLLLLFFLTSFCYSFKFIWDISETILWIQAKVNAKITWPVIYSQSQPYSTFIHFLVICPVISPPPPIHTVLPISSSGNLNQIHTTSASGKDMLIHFPKGSLALPGIFQNSSHSSICAIFSF